MKSLNCKFESIKNGDLIHLSSSFSIIVLDREVPNFAKNDSKKTRRNKIYFFPEEIQEIVVIDKILDNSNYYLQVIITSTANLLVIGWLSVAVLS